MGQKAQGICAARGSAAAWGFFSSICERLGEKKKTAEAKEERILGVWSTLRKELFSSLTKYNHNGKRFLRHRINHGGGGSLTLLSAAIRRQTRKGGKSRGNPYTITLLEGS